ncbi:MAG TPA: riboflavin biosynthesis protein RibF [Virgibacillus sp.]|nr:riboflavin biosynthesis protein RibF [Virgibacillus sp.]
MRTIELTYPHTLTATALPETVCAIGFFDGIHKGHQQVIKRAVQSAKEKNMESAVITFHPHPSVVLKQDTQHVKYITPLREKQGILQKLAVDRLYIITFNQQLSLLSPQEFIDQFITGLHIKHLIAGFDYTYGHKGKGNMDDLPTYAQGAFTSEVIDKFEMDGEKVSSTKIRDLLAQGEIEKVNELLGRPLRITGTVVEGDRRGNTIGYPTANIEVSEDVLLPQSGVYAVRVVYKNTSYDGMANLGVKPTFHSDEKEPAIEVNIFDFEGDLYGEELKVEWYTFIRNEKKFAGVDELIGQIKMDEKNIKNYFKERSVT